jgi:hypothetical protein
LLNQVHNYSIEYKLKESWQRGVYQSSPVIRTTLRPARPPQHSNSSLRHRRTSLHYTINSSNPVCKHAHIDCSQAATEPDVF